MGSGGALYAPVSPQEINLENVRRAALRLRLFSATAVAVRAKVAPRQVHKLLSGGSIPFICLARIAMALGLKWPDDVLVVGNGWLGTYSSSPEENSTP